jgi:hypothetical protein
VVATRWPAPCRRSCRQRAHNQRLLEAGDTAIALLADQARKAGHPVAGVIVLWSLLDGTTPPAQQLQWLHHAQVALATGLAPAPQSPVRIVIATAGAHSVLEEPIAFAGAATAMGPVLALPLEMPGLQMRLVDLSPTTRLDSVDAAASQSAGARDTEDLVALRAGRRWLRRYEHCRLPENPATASPVSPGAVVLITGGLGGMGLAIAQRLAQSAQARLLLTSRTALPPRGEWDAWLQGHGADDRHAQAIVAVRAIEAAGGEVELAVADAADAVWVPRCRPHSAAGAASTP